MKIDLNKAKRVFLERIMINGIKDVSAYAVVENLTRGLTR